MANTRENLRMMLIVRNSHEDHSKVSPPTVRVMTLSKTKTKFKPKKTVIAGEDVEKLESWYPVGGTVKLSNCSTDPVW